MSEELTNEAVDSAIILENRVNERVEKEVTRIINRELSKLVASEVHKAFEQYKNAMIMEISITVGKIMRNTEEENRKPLWETNPDEFGLDKEFLNKSSMRRLDDVQENLNAIHKIP